MFGNLLKYPHVYRAVNDSRQQAKGIAENRNSGVVAHVSLHALGREPENYSKTLSHWGEIRG